MGKGEEFKVRGTIVRVIDGSGHSGLRPWRALVQNESTNNIVHVSLSRCPDLQEGDTIGFTGSLKCKFRTILIDDVRVDIPPQVELTDDNAQGRLELLRANQILQLSSSDNTPIMSPTENLGQHPISVVRRPRRGSDMAVNWVVERFSERESSKGRGPIIVLDPALCSGFSKPDASHTEIPFVNKASIEYMQEATRLGRAGANTLFDRSDPRHRRWGVVIPRSLVHDPLVEWRGFVGINQHLYPSKLMSPEAAFKISLAHEMAHVVQEWYGISDTAVNARAQAEAFADSTAVLLYIIDGGDPEEARLYAHQRAAGAFQIPGAYSTGLACHAAITQGIRMRAKYFPESPSTDEILKMAYRITLSNLPPPKSDMQEALKLIKFSDIRNMLKSSEFDEWINKLSPELKRIFIVAKEGLLACALPSGEVSKAIEVLQDGWNALSSRLFEVGLGNLHGELQNTLKISTYNILKYGGTTASLEILNKISKYIIDHENVHLKPFNIHGHHIVAHPPEDSMTRLWAMSLDERSEELKTTVDAALSGNEEAVIDMGDVAMALLLDVDDRNNLSEDIYQLAKWAWVSSLPDKRNAFDLLSELSRKPVSSGAG